MLQLLAEDRDRRSLASPSRWLIVIRSGHRRPQRALQPMLAMYVRTNVKPGLLPERGCRSRPRSKASWRRNAADAPAHADADAASCDAAAHAGCAAAYDAASACADNAGPASAGAAVRVRHASAANAYDSAAYASPRRILRLSQCLTLQPSTAGTHAAGLCKSSRMPRSPHEPPELAEEELLQLAMVQVERRIGNVGGPAENEEGSRAC